MSAIESAGAIPRQSHPRGLATLFLTEMWERCSYYGMRALLVLFMVNSDRGGMGMDEKNAKAIYGIYTACVYLMSLPGGWLADRLIGAQRAVWYGGIIIALGHFTLALPYHETFYLGLILVVIGTGLLKPNMSLLVADLYPEGGARRDAGFSLFYMGVNLGATIGPLICSLLGENYNWHYGFGAAGVGMVLGLIQFRLTRKSLGGAGMKAAVDRPFGLAPRLALIAVTAMAVVGLGLCLTGFVRVNPLDLAKYLTSIIGLVAVLYFVVVLLFGGLSTIEKKRVAVIALLCLMAALFWSGFEQAGSSLNLFAERNTDRFIGWMHFQIPAGWFQMVNPIGIIIFAPIFAGVWVSLARRNLDPSIPVKFALGLLGLAVSFVIMAGAAEVVASGKLALPSWLVMTYLVQTFAELCLSPVGLSSVSKLSPPKLVGQMMGVWFLGASLGNIIAGQLAGSFNFDHADEWPMLYLKITILPAIFGVLLIVFAGPVKRWMGGVK